MKTFVTTTNKRPLGKLLLGAVVFLAICDLSYAASTGTLSGPITISIEGTNTAQVGDSLQWKLTLVNQSTNMQTNITQFTVYSFADFLEGSAPDAHPIFGVVDRRINTNAISAGQTNIQQITLTFPGYTGILSTADSFRCEAIVQTDSPSNDVWAGDMITSILTPSPSIFLSLAPSNIVTTGITVTASVIYTNIAPLTLHNFNIFISFAGSLAANGLLQTHEFNIGTVTQAQCVIVSTNAVAVAIGTNTVSATVEAGELKALSEQLDVIVQ